METVWLRRPSPDVPWGFRLQGGRDYQQPLSVQRVTTGSVASTALRAGDLILKISGISSDDLSHNDAQEIIKNTHDVLQLTIQKGGLLTPPEPVMSSSQAVPYDSYKTTPNGNVPAMSASSSAYYPYDQQQSGYDYSAQDGHGYQDPHRSGHGYHSPADAMSPTRGGYHPPSYESVTSNANYGGYSSPVNVDVKGYQRQSSQDSSSSRGYSRHTPSGTMSPSYGRTMSPSYGQSEQSYGRQLSNSSQPGSMGYGRTETVSPSYGEPSYGRQFSSGSQQRSETMSPSYGRQEPSYRRQHSNSSPQSFGYSSPTAQYSAPASHPQATWTYGAPLPPTETQPQYSYARQPSHEQAAPSEPQYSYGRQTSREQAPDPQYGYARQHSREQAQPQHAPRPQVSNTHSSMSHYPSNAMYQSSVSQNAYPYSSSGSAQDYSPSYTSQPYSSTQTPPGHDEIFVKHPARFTPRDNTTFASKKWEPSSPSPQFIPPPPPPIEQLQRESANQCAPGVPAAPPPPPPPPLPPIGGFKRPTHHSMPASSDHAQDGDSHIPDVVQKQMAKSPGSKTPFAYAAVSKDDLLAFKQKHRRHRKATAERDNTSPAKQPIGAHGQYSSPPDSYSEENLADNFIGQTPGVVSGVQAARPSPAAPQEQPRQERNYQQYIPKPASGPANKDFDPTQSATYRMIHGITDDKRAVRQRPKQDEPEPEFKPINQDVDMGYEDDACRKFLPSNPNKQSRSFRLLQRYTKDEEDDMDSAAREPSGVYEESHFTGTRESSATIPSKAFRKLQKFIGANPDEILEEVKHHKPKPRPVEPEEPQRHIIAPEPRHAPVPAHMSQAPIYEQEQDKPPKPESEMTPAELRAWRRQQKRKASGGDLPAYKPQPQWQQPPQQEYEGPARWEPPAQHSAWKVQPTPEWQAKVEKIQQKSETNEWEPLEQQQWRSTEPHQHSAWKVQPTPEWQAKVEKIQQKSEPSEWEPVQQPWRSSEPPPTWQAMAHQRRQSNEALAQATTMQQFYGQKSSAPAWQTDVRQKRDEDDESGVVEESVFAPKLYRGGNIPSKAFKKLQIATGSIDLNSSGATTKSSRSSSQRSTPSKELMQPQISKPFPERQLSYEEIKAKAAETEYSTAPEAGLQQPSAPEPVLEPPTRQEVPKESGLTEDASAPKSEEEVTPVTTDSESVSSQKPTESEQDPALSESEKLDETKVSADEEGSAKSTEKESKDDSTKGSASEVSSQEHAQEESTEEQQTTEDTSVKSTPPQTEPETGEGDSSKKDIVVEETNSSKPEDTPVETTAAESTDEKTSDDAADDKSETSHVLAKSGSQDEGMQQGTPEEKTGAE